MDEKADHDLPLVSIVIPMYDQEEHFLRSSIESAIGQTYLNTEIIISDNHSSNGASTIVAVYAQADKRIRIIKPDRFLPLIENFIFAYSQARGTYICPLSSDDILYPNMIAEHLVPFSSNPQLSFSYSIPLCFVKEITEAKWHPDKMDTGFYPLDVFLAAYIKRRHCTWGGILFKTANYNKTGGFSEKYSFAADADMIIKLILSGGGVYCINKALSAVRQWDREEHNNRDPYVLEDMAGIFDDIESKALNKSIPLHTGVAKRAKKKFFSQKVFPIAYYLRSKKRTTETIDKMAAVSMENYPVGMLNLVAKHRRNVLCLVFSMAYLGFIKLKNKLKHLI